MKLASLQTSFMALDEAIKITNRRVNALDNVVIPRLVDNYKYVDTELDEQEREELQRVKQVGACAPRLLAPALGRAAFGPLARARARARARAHARRGAGHRAQSGRRAEAGGEARGGAREGGRAHDVGRRCRPLRRARGL